MIEYIRKCTVDTSIYIGLNITILTRSVMYAIVTN